MISKRIAAPSAALALVALVSVLYGVRLSQASDHQDSPLMVSRPGADITDVYVFPAQDPKNVVLAMNVHPLIPRGMTSGVAFDPAVMYQLKIDTAGSYRENRVIQFRAVGTGEAQRIDVYGPLTPRAAGTTSRWAGTPSRIAFNRVERLTNGMKVFAGPRKDPFYFDLTQFFKLIPDRNYKNHPNPPRPSADCFRKPGVDFFSNYNVLSFIVELPRTMLAKPDGTLGVVHVWATTSLPSGSGSYTQVERLGRPAIKEAFEAFADHDRSNRSTPWDDVRLRSSIVEFMTAPKPAGAGRSAELANSVASVLIPDELTADLSAPGPAAYLAVETKGKSALPTGIVRVVPRSGLTGLKNSIANKTRDFGGRDFTSPVIDLSLGVIYGSLGQKVGLAKDDSAETACLTSDNVAADNRRITTAFPYAGAPI